MRSSVALAAAAAALLAPSPAHAWNVTATDDALGTATFTAAPGEVNAPKVENLQGVMIRLTDPSGPASAGPFCSASDDKSLAMCGYPDLLKVFLGDRSDHVLIGQALAASKASVNVAGQDGNDTVGNEGAPGTLSGGNGTDVIRPGLDQDVVVGGPGLDAIDYSERTTPIKVTFPGGATQGAANEGDDMKEVEAVFSGTGNDTLKGWKDPEQFVPGPGEDAVDTGGGDDKVDARDGFKDTIVCSPSGFETIYADQHDVVAPDCETVIVKHTLQGGGAGVKLVPPTPKDLPAPADQPAEPGTPQADPVPAPATPTPGDGSSSGAPASAADGVAPLLSAVKLDRQTIRRTGRAKGRATTLRFTASELSTVTVAIDRCAATVRATKRCALPTRVGAVTRKGLSGRAAVRLTAKLPGRMLRPGRYRLTVRAADAAGNRSKAVTKLLVVRP
jgi:hypothetical protein